MPIYFRNLQAHHHHPQDSRMSREHPSPNFALLSDSNIPLDSVIAALVAQCNDALQKARLAKDSQPNSGSTSKNTPGLGDFLWYLWEDVIRLAQEDVSTHGRLIEFMWRVKGLGSEGCDDWVVWEGRSNWGELPLFGPHARKNFNGELFE